MEYKIIVDSCCDLTQQLKKRLNALSVPLTLRLGQKEFIDDETLELDAFMSEMKQCTESVGSAAPSPFAYKEAIESAKNSFVVTLSSQVSGSYASARVGQELAEEEGSVNTHIFDSKSASAAETLVAVKIRELLQSGVDREQIISTVNRFIENMKTYFVLEKYDNLLKNGRLNKITGKIVNIMNIRLIMGADETGSIALFAKSIGRKQTIDKLLSLISSSGKATENESLVISHCNNHDMATQLETAAAKHFNFKEIFVLPMGGISSLYADDMGIVMAF